MVATNILVQARAYLGRGWSPVPVEAGGKRPLVSWEPFQQRMPTAAELDRWFKRWPDANIAVVTGTLSRLVVLDVDPRHGGDDSLAELERRYGPLPETVEAISGGGGRHIYFAHPGGIIHNRVAFVPGIDLRGDGGLIIVPPSLHPSGQRYEWEVSHHPEDLEPAPLPAWLLTLLKDGGGHPGHPGAYWRGLIRSGVAEGQRNNSIASIAGHRCPTTRWPGRSIASGGPTNATRWERKAVEVVCCSAFGPMTNAAAPWRGAPGPAPSPGRPGAV